MTERHVFMSPSRFLERKALLVAQVRIQGRGRSHLADDSHSPIQRSVDLITITIMIRSASLCCSACSSNLLSVSASRRPCQAPTTIFFKQSLHK